MAIANVAIVSTGQFSGDRIFEPALARDNVLQRFKLLRENLQSLGMTCHTLDMFAPMDVDVLVFHDIMNELAVILKIVNANPTVRLVYIPNEPDFVVPMHDEKVLPGVPVDLLLTWNDRIAGKHAHVKKQNIGQPIIDARGIPSIPFAEKKFICSIFAYKPPGVSGTLFEERLKAVEVFNDKAEGMDLFGIGWEESELHFVKSSYRGRCESKLGVQKQYKFSVAFENAGTLRGLITEKIFDCFAAGTVPVYLGAPNIKDHIPGNCFIDFRDFGDYGELYEYLVKMPETQYQAYLEAAGDFVNSAQYYIFTSACFAENTSRWIDELNLVSVKRSPLRLKFTLIGLIIKHPGMLRHWRRFKRLLLTLLFTW